MVCSSHRRASQPRCVVVLGGLDREHHHVDRPGHLAGIGEHRTRHDDRIAVVGPQFDAVAGGVAAQQHRVAGLVQQRGDRRADGAGTHERDGGGNATEVTNRAGCLDWAVVQIGQREYLCCAATPPVRCEVATPGRG